MTAGKPFRLSVTLRHFAELSASPNNSNSRAHTGHEEEEEGLQGVSKQYAALDTSWKKGHPQSTAKETTHQQ
jgi:hypothetical protein